MLLAKLGRADLPTVRLFPGALLRIERRVAPSRAAFTPTLPSDDGRFLDALCCLRRPLLGIWLKHRVGKGEKIFATADLGLNSERQPGALANLTPPLAGIQHREGRDPEPLGEVGLRPLVAFVAARAFEQGLDLFRAEAS